MGVDRHLAQEIEDHLVDRHIPTTTHRRTLWEGPTVDREGNTMEIEVLRQDPFVALCKPGPDEWYIDLERQDWRTYLEQACEIARPTSAKVIEPAGDPDKASLYLWRRPA